MKMYLNEETKAKLSDSRFDVCIVGSGPAGITLALSLEKLGKSVCLLEGGSEDFTEDSQALYKGKNIGDTYFHLDRARLRFLGGSSNHWTGWCKTLDDIDFNRNYITSGLSWPICKADMDPWLDEACGILGIDPMKADSLPTVIGSELVKTGLVFDTAPLRFKERFAAELDNSNSVTLLLNANFKMLNGHDGAVKSVSAISSENIDVIIYCNTVVLATGGLENSRLLLHVSKEVPDKFFPTSLPIGKYWMEHPFYELGTIVGDEDVLFSSDENMAFLRPSDEFQKKYKIFNSCFILQKLKGPEFNLEKEVKDLLRVAPNLENSLFKLMRRNKLCGASINVVWEQSPNVESAVRLSDEVKDRFGIQSIELNWRKSEIDRETLVASIAALCNWVLESTSSRLRLQDWVIRNDPYPDHGHIAASHHMGGTRMSVDETTGVVDAELKVHGSKNIYVAGSSVFPTAGWANPTLSIVQLSLRLASHLSRRSSL